MEKNFVVITSKIPNQTKKKVWKQIFPMVKRNLKLLLGTWNECFTV